MTQVLKDWLRQRNSISKAITSSPAFRMAMCFLTAVQPATVVLAENPTGGTVVAGAGDISAIGSTLNVNTTTDRAVIDWQSFNIGSGHTTNFNQPGANSAVLNRVLGADNPTAIYGSLNSNGNVYVVNPSGVLIGPSGMVNTNGFTASTLDIANQEFMQGGSLQFSGSGIGRIINQGSINTGSGGTTLLANEILNEGTIESLGGSVNLITGGTVQLNAGGTYTHADAQTIQNGVSETAGLIRNSGTIRAMGALEVGGELYLVSPGGKVMQDGILAATKIATPESTVGGTVVITGNDVEISGGTIDASGVLGGGQVSIGGGFQGKDASILNSESTTIAEGANIAADALVSGDGGSVIVWSNGHTDYRGNISAKGANSGQGGFTEISGKESLNFAGLVNTGGGNLLLDPYNYTIDGTAAGNLVTALGSNNVTVQTTTDVTGHGSSGTDTDDGDITVNSDILWDSENSFTLLAQGDIHFNKSVQNRNATGGDLNIIAGWDGETAFDATTFEAVVVTDAATLFGLNEGSVFIGNGTQYPGIAVGSRSGTTRLFAHNLSILGSSGANNSFAQLGFQVSDGIALGSYDLDGGSSNGSNVPVTGGITVHTMNDITATAGGSQQAYAQLGHIGADLSSDSNSEAAVDAAIEISAGHDIKFTGGTGQYAYAQLGHGGFYADGDHAGSITITTVNDMLFKGGTGHTSYVHLGQGGSYADGNHSSTTTITSANDITFEAGNSGVTTPYALLGQGGYEAIGSHSGETTITSAHDILFKAGSTPNAFAQLGQGGRGSLGNHEGTTVITSANDITFLGGSGNDSYAQLGQGGHGTTGNHSGTTTITSAHDIKFEAGTAYNTYAQLGQGGFAAVGNHSGTTTIASANDLTLNGNSGGFSFAQLGHGGLDSDGNHSGTIDVTIDGDLTLSGLNTTSQYATIGNGDNPTDGDTGNTVAGDVTLRIGNDTSLTNGFIGHMVDGDGTYTGGDTLLGVRGDLTADAASQFTSAPDGAGELRLYIGGDDLVNTSTLLNGTAHGGTEFPNDQGTHSFGEGPYSPDVGHFAYYRINPNLFNYIVNSNEASAIASALGTDAVTLASDLNQPLFGAHYDWDGGTQFINVNSDLLYDSTFDLTLLSAGDINFNAGVQNRNATSGDLNIVAGWDLTTAFDATTFGEVDVTESATLFGNNSGTVTIGDGSQESGIAVGSRSGTTRVFASDLNLNGSESTENAYSQLGFKVTNGVALGDHDLDSESDDGDDVTISGDIIVHSLNDITATAGDANFTYAQIGHVGADISNDSEIDAHVDASIDLLAGNNISFNAGDGASAYAQVGHGGFGAIGNLNGTIRLTLNGDLTLSGIDVLDQYAVIGHGNQPGNSDSSQTVAGDITIRVDGSAELENAFIGHLIDEDGSYTSGNTFIAIGLNDFTDAESEEQLTADANSQFMSSPDGELRFYMPLRDSWNVHDDAKLNGILSSVATGNTPFLNEGGRFDPFEGKYAGTEVNNFAFYFGQAYPPAASGKFVYDLFQRPHDYFETIDSLLPAASGGTTVPKNAPQTAFGPTPEHEDGEVVIPQVDVTAN